MVHSVSGSQCSAKKNKEEQLGDAAGAAGEERYCLLMCKCHGPRFVGMKTPVLWELQWAQFYYDRWAQNFNCINVQFWGQYVQFFLHGGGGNKDASMNQWLVACRRSVNPADALSYSFTPSLSTVSREIFIRIFSISDLVNHSSFFFQAFWPSHLLNFNYQWAWHFSS